MSLLISFLLTSAVAVVFWNSIELAAHLDKRLWPGQRYRFGAFAFSIALTAAGAVGLFFGWVHAPWLLLLGIAGKITFGRREFHG